VATGKITLPHECPKCGEKANNETELRKKFGLRTMTAKNGNKIVRNQSWCKGCR